MSDFRHFVRSLGYYGHLSPDAIGPHSMQWTSTSGGTAFVGSPITFDTGFPSYDGLHPHETVTVELLTPGVVVHAVQPETLHLPCDYAVVGSAALVIAVRPVARFTNRVRLRRWLQRSRPTPK